MDYLIYHSIVYDKDGIPGNPTLNIEQQGRVTSNPEWQQFVSANDILPDSMQTLSTPRFLINKHPTTTRLDIPLSIDEMKDAIKQVLDALGKK